MTRWEIKPDGSVQFHRTLKECDGSVDLQSILTTLCDSLDDLRASYRDALANDEASRAAQLIWKMIDTSQAVDDVARVVRKLRR